MRAVTARKSLLSLQQPDGKADAKPWGLWNGREPRGNVHSWQAALESPVSGIGYQLWVTSKGSWTSLKVDGSDPTEAAHLFEQFERHRDEIEVASGASLGWRSSPDRRSAAIRWDNPVPGGRNSDRDAVEQAAEWIAADTARIVAATIEHVRTLVPYEPDPGDSELEVEATPEPVV